MIVLGVGVTPDGHDSSAAIVADGRLLAAAEEERFTRVKHDGRPPVSAVRFCLEHAGISMADVDTLAIPDRPFRTGRDSQLAWADRLTVDALVDRGLLPPRARWHKRLLDATRGRQWPGGFGMNPTIRLALATLADTFGPLPALRFHGHHEAHAAAAFYLSGLEEAAVLTVDGRGGMESAVIWRGDDRGLEPLFAQPYVDSLGFFYRDCTRYLGLGDFAEGKTMGLAPYGHPGRFSAHVAELLNVRELPLRYLRPPSEQLLGFPPRDGGSILEGPYADFAASAQRALEHGMRTLADSARHLAGSGNLCLGGGVALNCSANGRLVAEGDASRVFIFPAAGDAGLSVGAALLSARAAGSDVRARLDHARLGPEISEAQIRRAVADSGPGYRVRTGTRPEDVAGLIAGGSVVGWVQGRMEFGPRALGGRSILADPRSAEVRDRVNELKRREQWRPLAPMVLKERAGEFFDDLRDSPFMLLASSVRADRRRDVAGVVHVDGSARPQTVSREGDPVLRRLIEAFAIHAGVPILLNTSFNAAGEPIVCTADDAIRSFSKMGLDALVIDDWLIERAPA